MLNTRRISFVLATLAIAVALGLLIERGGLIAWTAFFVGLALLAKFLLKPSQLDLGLSVGFVVVFSLAWAGTWYHVISTWESGEVVELIIDTSEGERVARVWVMDIGSTPTVYYDAEPEMAMSLLAGKPLQYSRAGKVSTRVPDAIRVDDLPEQESDQILQAMQKKYGDRNGAAVLYYALLGTPRDRIPLVVRLIE